MIKANFNAYANYVTDSLYQWDRNQVLTVSGLNITTLPEIHFSNSAMDKAIVRQVDFTNRTVTVQIPNSLLQTALPITANIGIYEGDTFKTVETITIPVIAKARPADYQIEKDEEIYSFEALKNHIANMVTRKDYDANNTVVNARIDNLISHNNDTESNSELVDMRIGYDGKSYNSTGRAIRTQSEEIIKTLRRSGLYSETIITGERKLGKYVTKNSGMATESTQNTRGVIIYDISEYVGKMLQIRTVANSDTMYAWALAKSNGTIIEIVNGYLEYNDIVEIPSDAHTLYVNYAISEEKNNNVMVKVFEYINLIDRFDKHDTDLENVNTKLDTFAKDGILRLFLKWEMGGISTLGEIYSPDDIRIRTKYYYKPTFKSINYIVPDGYKMLAVFYTYSEDIDEYIYSRHRGYVTGAGSFDINEGEYIRFVLRGVEEMTFTGNEYELLTLYHDSESLVTRDEVKTLIKEYDQYSVPDYWIDTIKAKEQEIKNIIFSKVKSNNDVAVFFAISDPHYPDNTGVSTSLMRYLSQKCGIGLTICLGDLIADSPISRDDGLSRIKNGMDNLNAMSDRAILTQGNHDTNVQINDSNGEISADRIIYDNEWILHTNNRLLNINKIVFDELGKAFYYDDDILKIRFISIDSFEGKTYTINDGKLTSLKLGQVPYRQTQWLKTNALATVPPNYSVITFSHLSVFSPLIHNGNEFISLNVGQMGNAGAVREALTQFKTNGGIHIGHFAGHLHHDFVSINDSIVNVNLLNDGLHWRERSYYGNNADLVGDSPKKISGTVNECAFDVVIVDKTNKHVDLIRIGAGDNRQFDY